MTINKQQNPFDTSSAVAGWLQHTLGTTQFVAEPAYAHKHAPPYFRITIGDETRVLIDASSVAADYGEYSKVSRLMRVAHINAPEVIAEDVKRGFFLLGDMNSFGTQTYADALNETNADALFRDARETLIKWQLASQADTLPTSDAAFLQRELNQFSDNYIVQHMGVTLTSAQQEMLTNVLKVIVEANLAQANVYVHRDYVPANLLVSESDPGILGFQGAMFGAISYDIASLYKDVQITCDEERALDGTIRYWESAKKANLPVPADFGDFYRDAEWMGLQRHLKLMGTLTPSGDGTTLKHLDEMPRLVRYVRKVGERYTALFPLIRLFDKLNINDGVARTVGISF
jgi:N-acetylmuramate 1-kinase